MSRVKSHLIEQALCEVVAKHSTYVDPFSCQHLQITEHGEKIVVTIDKDSAVAREGTILPNPRNAQQKNLDQDVAFHAEDYLAPVFFEIALKLLPNEFDFRMNRKILLVGGPSCGKTMLVKHMAVLCATKQDIPRGHKADAFVPLVLSIADLTKFIDMHDLTAEDDILLAYFQSKYSSEISRAKLAMNLICTCHAWLFLDGLDEAASPKSLEILVKFLDHLTLVAPNLRIIVTSRHGAEESIHRPALIHMGFTRLRMRPLTTDLAETMLSKRLCGNPGSVLFPHQGRLPDWLRSEIRRPVYKLFRKSPLTLILLVNVLQDLDRENGAVSVYCPPPLLSPANMLTPPSIGSEGRSAMTSPLLSTSTTSSASASVDSQTESPSDFGFAYEQKESLRIEDISKGDHGASSKVGLHLSLPGATPSPSHGSKPKLGALATTPSYGGTLGYSHNFAHHNYSWQVNETAYHTSANDEEGDNNRMDNDGGEENEETAEERRAHDAAVEAHYKQSCPGITLKPPFSRVDLLRRALIKLLNLQPVERRNKTTCSSPMNRSPILSPYNSSRSIKLFPESGLSLEMPSNLLKSFDEVDPNLLELLQLAAYITHDRNTRELRLNDLRVAASESSDPAGGERALNKLLKRIESNEVPLFTIEDREDYLDEETLEQRMHQQPRAAFVATGSPDELKRKGIMMFLHITLQEHLCAEYIANNLLNVLEKSRPQANVRENLINEEKSTGGKLQSDQENITAGSQNRRWSRQRSRSIVVPERGLRRYGSSTPRVRRSSVPETRNHELLDINKLPEVRARIKSEVERLLLGHFRPESFRVNQEWWQPVILLVFDLLAEQGPPAVKCGGLFDIVLDIIVESCRRLMTLQFGEVPTALSSFWLAAAAHGNVRVVKGMIQIMGAQVLLQSVNADQNNALHLAAINNQPEIIKLLMAEENVDPDYLDRNNEHGWDPSNMAMIFNHTYCFRLLCYTDGDKVAETCNPRRRPDFVDAAMKGDLAKVKRLLKSVLNEVEKVKQLDKDKTCDKSGERVSKQMGSPSYNSSATSSAYQTEKDAARRRLGINRMCSSPGLEHDQTLAERRKVRQHQRMLRTCLDARSSSGMTALMWASRNGHDDIVDYLIKSGANIKLKAQGISALIFAVESGHVGCVKLLLNAGANPMDRTSDDDSSLLCACSFGFDDVAKVLIGAGASALEALVVSCVQGKNATVRSLVEADLVDVNTVWEDLMVTPLAGACVAGHLSTVRLLLALGADPNIPIDVEYGSTPLMLASHMGNLEVVQSILDAGADVHTRAPPSSQCALTHGKDSTAISMAKKNNNLEVELLLRSRGAKQYVPVDLEFYEWLGGQVRYPDRAPDFEQRRRSGVQFKTLMLEDPYFHRIDLRMWQFLGGRTQGEAAWDLQ